MKKIVKKESNILLSIALITYILLNAINKFIVNVPSIIYVTVMLINIGIILSALRSQKEGK